MQHFIGAARNATNVWLMIFLWNNIAAYYILYVMAVKYTYKSFHTCIRLSRLFIFTEHVSVAVCDLLNYAHTLL